jgi:hypothetical protein
VRAREDARGDLMRARHRLSKLLLRHGMVYDATSWTRAHDAWLRRQRFQSGPLAIVFDECYGRMLDAKTRRDALDKAIAELAALRRCRRAARLPPRRLHADRIRVDRRARRLEQVPTGVARPVPRPHPQRELKRGATPPRRDHQGRQLARPSSPGRGRLAPTPPTAPERHARTQTHRQTARRASPSRPQRPPTPRTLARARETRQAPHDHRRRRRPRTRRTLLGTRDDGLAATTNGSARRAHRRNDARSDPREHCEQPQQATLDARQRHRPSPRTPGQAAPTRAYESRHKRRRQPMRSPRRSSPRAPRGQSPLRA